MRTAHSIAIVTMMSMFSACSSATAEAPPTVVAVGDLHADAAQAIATLRLAGIVDTDGHWSGGATTLVQTGDVTDRGPDSKRLMDLMDQLAVEASAAGGEVRSLLGNHEAMNLLGDWRYVHPGDVAQFGGAEARRAAFAEDGRYAAWVQRRDVVTKVGETVFCHGGITPEWAARGVDGINVAARQALEARNSEAPVLGPSGPLWYRGYVQQPETDACPALSRALDALGATRMVVGHTTRRDGKIQTRCGGRLSVIDIGIASHYGGHTGVWVLDGDDARALYPTGRSDLEDPVP